MLIKPQVIRFVNLIDWTLAAVFLVAGLYWYSQHGLTPWTVSFFLSSAIALFLAWFKPLEKIQQQARRRFVKKQSFYY